MPLTHVLFDLDNTLYPDTSGIMQMFDQRISAYVADVLKLDMEAARQARHEFYTTYGTTLRGLQVTYGDQIDVEHYLSYVHELEMDAFLKLDAALDARLAEIRAPKSVFTNSPIEHTQRVLAALGVERHFKHIFDIRYHQFEPKPATTTYQRVLDALGLAGRGVVFLEDSPQNLPPAKQLGMTTILLSPQANDAAVPPADFVVPDILSALSVVLELERG
ncbi:MAG: pyrimidine 5'-nucleotidase [Roseiflexaceae bacterium]|nr:pyrimidine 5'-nucleotidase [Roseiflexaceae bacterium]